MIIDKLKVSNFKKFNDLEIEFDRGLNVVIGPNETGKSTLSRALLEAVYADPTTKAKKFFDQIYPWNNANDLKFELYFHNSDAKFLLKKDFTAGSIVFENLDTGLKLTSQKEVLQAIDELTGIPTKEIYESTAYVKQSDVASIDTSNDFISAIQKAASSGGSKANVQNILSELGKELKKLNVGMNNPAKHPGPIKQLTDRISSIRSELLERKAQWQNVNMASINEKESGGELKRINSQIEMNEKLLANYRTRKEAYKNLQAISKQIEQIESKLKLVEDADNKKQQIRSKLSAYADIESVNINEFDQKLSEVVAGKKVIESELSRLESELERAKKREIKVQSNTKLLIGATVAAILVVISLLVSLATGNFLFLAGGLIVGVISFGVAWILQQAKPVMKLDEELISGLKTQQELMQSKYEENTKQRQEILKRFSVSSEEEYYTKRGEYLASREQLKEAEAQIKGALGGISLESIKQEQLSHMTTKKEIEHTVLTEEVKSADLKPEEYLAKTRELDSLYLNKKKLEEENTRSKVRVEDAGVSRTDIVSLEEQLESMSENLAYYEKRAKALDIAIETLQEAITDTANNAGKVVSEIIEKYLPKLTKGRYKNARLTDELGVEVFSDEKNDWIDPSDTLSSGTIDQIYFLTRIAFLKNLTKDLTVPIILDDPFVTFDAERRDEVKTILEELVQTNQVILLTHSDEYAKWGNKIELGELVK